jgi:hypothetical protein
MKLLSVGMGGWLAEQAGVEAVYYVGGTLLFLSGLTGLVVLRSKRLIEA